MQNSFSNIRHNYSRDSLRIENLDRLPLVQLQDWLNDAIRAQHTELTAMSLATVDATGQPTQRIVLLKDISDGGISFFTNYLSSKGQHLEINPKAAAEFFWPSLERQVRLEGIVKKLPAHQSDLYFSSRPRESQIGAWASPQSEIVRDSEFLIHQYQEFEQKFEGKDVPRPPHWGGYILIPHKVEFWQGRPNRMHDRFVYRLNEKGKWDINQLAP